MTHKISYSCSFLSGRGGCDPGAEADASAVREDQRDAGQLQHALRHQARARDQGLQGKGPRIQPLTVKRKLGLFVWFNFHKKASLLSSDNTGALTCKCNQVLHIQRLMK